MKIYKNSLEPKELETAESILFNGNGHLGIRNVVEESDEINYSSNRHTYLIGFYDTYAINYPEQYYGASTIGEQMLPVIDGSLSKIKIGQTFVNENNGTISEHERYIDIEKAISYRTYCFTDCDGVQTKITIERIASFTNQEQLITNYRFTKINHQLPIEIITCLNLIPDHNVDHNDPRLAHNSYQLTILENDWTKQKIQFQAPNSKIKGYMKWAVSELTMVESDAEQLRLISKVHGTEYTKCLTYSLDDYVEPILNYKLLKEKQEKYMQAFWRVAQVKISCQDEIETSVNYGIFALLSSLGTNSIAAKGLSGIGYEGHVFWDAEMYILPLFIKIDPKRAREMLMFRIKMLDQAIANRKQVGYPTGALYPWRTISGRESSAFFEAGMAQHHINLDISYGLNEYLIQTDDKSILTDGGFEMIYQIALMFASLVYKRDGQYHLDMVTGPDEYSALVNDNYYTNGLVKGHFNNIISYVQADTTGQLKLSSDEMKLFKDIANNIALEFDEARQIVKQDRDFLNKKQWPYELNGDKPLLLAHHPLEIYRHQISKQADVVLAMQLFGRKSLSKEIIANTISYYEKVTTHDSSLSFSNFATVYARLKNDLAYEYFMKNAVLDLQNLHHNTKDGLHTASMGGTYQTLVEGFSNFQIVNEQIVVENLLPKEITYLEYNIYFKGQLYNIKIKSGEDPQLTKVEK